MVEGVGLLLVLMVKVDVTLGVKGLPPELLLSGQTVKWLLLSYFLVDYVLSSVGERLLVLPQITNEQIGIHWGWSQVLCHYQVMLLFGC